ncbi:tyrosine-type recombinase/integrase [Clostridium polynesiense]|uniref:tyrosine-type recombinase/integrase n=1 Tax=Clostridium polynesiense TaxID=1325933 RepID=UPI00058F63BE|nr:site-specific integrase [Clostridium polynesiense]
MSIRETAKGYYVEVFLGKDPLSNKKIRKTKLFPGINRNSLKQAKLWEAETLSAYKTGDIDLKGGMKLSSYLDFWYETYVLENCAYTTQRRYKTLCECIKSNLGHLSLEQIKAPIIDRFYKDLKKETITLKDGTVKRRYMDGTILKVHKVFKQALDKACAWDMIVKNPVTYATPPADDERNINTWSIEEIENFLKFIEQTPLYLPVFIAFHTGLREGEICALRWEDIDFDTGLIHVRNTAVEKPKIGLELEDPKTAASKASVTMTKQLTEKLKLIKTERFPNDSKVISITAKNEEDILKKFVCINKDDLPVRPCYVSQAFTKYVKKIGYKKITFHGLRHSHATILFINGATSQEVSKRLRHSKVSTTDDIYIHVTEEIKKSTADMFSKAVENAK